jgi:hypothetical protein
VIQSPSQHDSSERSRDLKMALWLLAGATWVFVAVTAWARVRRTDARRKTMSVSERMLRQVFPRGLPRIGGR